MRVLLSCLQSHKRHPIAAYDFWRSYFVHGGEEAGIEFVEVPDVDWAEGLVHPPGPMLDEWRARTWEKVLAFVRGEQARNPVDFFLGYLYPCQVEAAAITELQRTGIPCVNFFCDNVREFSKVPDAYSAFSLHWVPEFEALEMYRRGGLPHLHAPMPCWVPETLRTVPATESEPPTFIGSEDVLRRALLGRAIEAGAELFIRGPGWKESGEQVEPRRSSASGWLSIAVNQVAVVKAEGVLGLIHKVGNRLSPLRGPAIPPDCMGPAATGAEYFRISREAQVTIGVNRVPTARASNRNPLSYSRLRDIEAPMLGACYLTEWTPGLDRLYEVGVEVESYRTHEELAGKIRELQADPVRRGLMRDRAQRRALSEHSVARSLRRICDWLGLHKQA